jgi:hypothetical protein
MANIMRDRFNRPGETANVGLALAQAEKKERAQDEVVSFQLVDGETGEVIEVSPPRRPEGE